MDGECRRPSNELSSGPSVADWSPASFAVLDFNGDRQADLVGAFAEHIEFRESDPDGAFPPGFVASTLPVSGEVAIGQLDGDEYGDVLLPTERGLLVWRGQAEGPPLEVVYAAYRVNPPSDIEVVPMRYPTFVEDLLVLLYPQTGKPSELGACIVGPDGNGRGCRTIVDDYGFDQVHGRVSVGDFDEDSQDELTMAFEGASAVKIFGVHNDLLGGGGVLGVFGPFQLPAPIEIDIDSARRCEACADVDRVDGLQIDKGVYVADVDGDSHVDLLVSVSGAAPAQTSLLVARGDGQGSFEDPYLDARFAALASRDSVPAEVSIWPLAVGNFDDAGAADYVSANGVFLSRPAELSQTYQRDTLLPWTQAVIADFDGDSDYDVAAIHEGEPRVDVLRCGPAASSCAVHPYFPDRSVSQLHSARLQGSAASDILFVERGRAGEDDSLSVMYGLPDDLPAPPRRQARFHHIDRFSTALGRYPGWPTVDPYQDVVVTTRNVDDVSAVAALFADGARAFSSPYFAESSRSLTRRALTGRFSASNQPMDDLVLFGASSSNQPRAWWIPGAKDAAFVATLDGHDLRVELPDFDLNCARFAAGDIDADHVEEVVIVYGCGATTATRWAVGRVSEDGNLQFKTEDLAIAPDEGRTEIALADLNGDGPDDLLIARAGILEVAWGGEGGLAMPVSFTSLPDEQVRAAVAISRSGSSGGAERVAILTDASVVVLAQDGSATTLDSHGAHNLRSADVDGDGLGDLLLSTESGIEILLSIPAPPLGDGK